MTKIRKHLQILIIGGLTLTLVLTPLVASSIIFVNKFANKNNNQNILRYRLNLYGQDLYFDSKDEAKDYFASAYTSQYKISIPSFNDETQKDYYFDSLSEVVHFIQTNKVFNYYEKNIYTSKEVFNSIDLDNELIRIPDDTLSNTTTIYKTSLGGFTSEKDQAIKTYIHKKDLLQFNNIYFETSSDLEHYLRNVYYLDENSPGFITGNINKYYHFSNNNISFKKSDFDLSQEEFIKTNAYEAMMSKAQKYVKFPDGTIVSFDELISYQPNEPILNYTTLYTNEGISKYVVDTKSTSPGDIIGSRFLESDGTIRQITDPNNWFSIPVGENQSLTKSKFVNILNKFLNLLISLDENYPFALSNMGDYSKEFYEKLKKEYSDCSWKVKMLHFLHFTKHILHQFRF